MPKTKAAKSRKLASVDASKDTPATTPFTAYVVGDGSMCPIEPAPSTRDWMDATHVRFAYRCLPLVIANQNGWIIPSPTSFTVRWNGGHLPTDTKVKGPKGVSVNHYVASHFGYGVVTFIVPYLFRTPPGINLWVKGPSNYLKDGIQALEGVVETDWLESSFTMNWKCTRRNVTVKFEKGDPLCMIVPVPRGLLESLHPECRPLSENRELEDAYARWRESRKTFNEKLLANDPATVEQGWQRDYMLGRKTDGAKFEGHQTKLTLRPFPPPK